MLILPSEHYLTMKAPLAGIFQRDLAQLLKEFGVQTGVLSAGFIPFASQFKPYPYKSYDIENGIPVFRRYMRTLLPGKLAMRFLYKRLIMGYVELFKAYIKKYGIPDIVHAHNALFAGAAALEIKRRYGVPFILTEHSSLYERGYINAEQLKISRKVFGEADAKTVVSTKHGLELSKHLGENVFPHETIYNVLDRSFQDANIAFESKPCKEYTVLSIGNLDDNKNHISLIRAFVLAFPESDYSHVRLVIGGSGPSRSTLQSEILKLNAQQRISLLGRLSRSEVKNALVSSDVFVLPSKVETFGVVLIEALALGKPIISTFSGGPEDIVSPNNGILVPPDDDTALSMALQTMYVNRDSYDPSEIRSQCLSKFGRERFYDKLSNIYYRLI